MGSENIQLNGKYTSNPEMANKGKRYADALNEIIDNFQKDGFIVTINVNEHNHVLIFAAKTVEESYQL